MNSNHYDPKKLTDLRTKKGETQEQVAESIGKARMTIIRAERGEVASYNLLCLLAKHYKVPVVSILRSAPKTAA